MAGFGLGLAVLAANALVAYQTVVTLTEASRSVKNGLRLMDSLREVRSAVSRSEAGQRSYIITGDKDYLEYSRDLLKTAGGRLGEIRVLAGDDPAGLEQIGLLESLIAARAAEFESAIGLHLDGKNAAAIKSITTDRTKETLARTHEAFSRFGATLDELLARRTRELQRNSELSLVTLYTATLFSLALLGLVYYLVYREIAERRQAEEKLRMVATRDPLTALPNRSLFRERLESAIAKAQRHGTRLAVLFIDLDRFKNINDTLGHEAGDMLLQVAAQRLSDRLRGIDMIARQGGDEFVVLVDELSDPAQAARLSQEILDAMAKPFVLCGQEFRVTASIGISTYPDDGRDMHALLKNADIAMYRAKEKGKNAFQFYSAQIDGYSMERLSLESSLCHALEREELALHYQPKVDAATGHVCGVEALLRWRHPDLGWIAPERFIPLAEESGLIVPIGAWALKTACAQARTWQRQGLSGLRVAVNLSPRQFASERLIHDIEAALHETGLEATALELEITESMVMNNPEQAVNLLGKLKSLGISLAIDDFGTGYSSLAYLKRFPIDSVKVDRSFIQDIPGDEESVAITRAVIAMAHSLRLKVVAEGVENEAQLEFLRSLGCDEMQGYCIGKPLPAGEVSQLIRKTLPRGKTLFLPGWRRKVS